jgi:hypothetical protein
LGKELELETKSTFKGDVHTSKLVCRTFLDKRHDIIHETIVCGYYAEGVRIAVFTLGGIAPDSMGIEGRISKIKGARANLGSSRDSITIDFMGRI